MNSNGSSSRGHQRDAKGRFTSDKKKPEKKDKKHLERDGKGRFTSKKKPTIVDRSRSRSRSSSRDSRRRGRSTTRKSLVVSLQTARFPSAFSPRSSSSSSVTRTARSPSSRRSSSRGSVYEERSRSSHRSSRSRSSARSQFLQHISSSSPKSRRLGFCMPREIAARSETSTNFVNLGRRQGPSEKKSDYQKKIEIQSEQV